MTPADSQIAQIEKYRRMSGDERLLVGLRLHELSCEIARDGIRAEDPGATEEQVAEPLRHRLKLAYRIGAVTTTNTWHIGQKK